MARIPSQVVRAIGIAAPAAVAAFAAADAINLYANRGAAAARRQDNILFPLDLNRDSDTPYISMRFREYYRRSIREQPFFREVTTIRLPIPSNLVENTSVDYGKAELGTVLGATADAISSALGPADFSDRLPGIISQTLTGVGVGVVGAALSSRPVNAVGRAVGISNLSQDLRNAASVVTGITTNPYQVVLFKNPNFRTHKFSWKFIPQSRQESDELKKLIDTFKYHSLPGISRAGGVFFSYPEILEITFRPDDYYMYKFKPCVVDTINVNYAPNGPSFFKSSGAPAAIQFDINVQEVEIWTKADDIRTSDGRIP